MYEFGIKLANLHIEISCFYETSKNYCEKYLDFDNKKSDFKVEISKNDLNHILELMNKGNHTVEEKQDRNLEINSIHGKIAQKLPDFDKFVVHGTAISYKDKAYLFIAPSGTGKTTHAKLWQKNLEGVEIINGDKPIVSIENGETHIYGSPWSGTERYNTNTKVKLDSIIVLKQNKEDRIIEIDSSELFDELLDKVFYSEDRTKTLDLINKAFKNIKSYKLECTMNDSAFEVAYRKLIEK